MPRKQLERIEQIRFVTWFKYKWPEYKNLIAHFANGGSRNPREGKHFKDMGVLAGMCDLGIFVPTDDYSGMFIEMKKRIEPGKAKPRIDPKQREVMKDLIAQGYKVAVAYGCDEAEQITLEYLESLGKRGRKKKDEK